MRISRVIFRQKAVDDEKLRGGSKMSVQQGRSHFCARSVLVLREHGKMARTPLAAFFNSPIIENELGVDRHRQKERRGNELN